MTIFGGITPDIYVTKRYGTKKYKGYNIEVVKLEDGFYYAQVWNPKYTDTASITFSNSLLIRWLMAKAIAQGLSACMMDEIKKKTTNTIKRRLLSFPC